MQDSNKTVEGLIEEKVDIIDERLSHVENRHDYCEVKKVIKAALTEIAAASREKGWDDGYREGLSGDNE